LIIFADVMALKNDNELASQSSSSSEDTDDDDDNISVCSVKWTFSPFMKCLSPLPPSPACFAERKVKISSIWSFSKIDFFSL
jgi:hypothetical protein